jgi:hypothetical protein
MQAQTMDTRRLASTGGSLILTDGAIWSPEISVHHCGRRVTSGCYHDQTVAPRIMRQFQIVSTKQIEDQHALATAISDGLFGKRC